LVLVFKKKKKKERKKERKKETTTTTTTKLSIKLLYELTFHEFTPFLLYLPPLIHYLVVNLPNPLQEGQFFKF